MFTYAMRPVELGQGVYVHIELKPETTKRNHQNETTETSKINK